MTVDTADGKIELSAALLKLTKPEGTVLQWDKGSISDGKDAALAKRAVIACIGFDTNILSNGVILGWIKSRQLALAMFAEYKRQYPGRTAEFTPLIESAKVDLDCVSQSLVEATKAPSRTSDVVRAERFNELKATAEPFFNFWWAVKKKATSFPVAVLPPGLKPGQAFLPDSHGKLIPELNSYSNQADWNTHFKTYCTAKNRKDIALSQTVFALLAAESNVSP